MEDIHDIKGLVPLPQSLWWLWVLTGMVVVVAAAWFWKRRKPTTATETVAPPSAYEVALRALQHLREENPPVEQFYTRLSDIVRQYLEGQFGLRAPERTTEEFFREVSRDQTLSTEHQELLERFLQESDLVKFARLRRGEEDKKRVFAAAEKFVRESVVGATSRSRWDEPVAAGAEPRCGNAASRGRPLLPNPKP